MDSRYEIVREIGSGGMARVYLARQKGLDRDVAIKILKREVISDKEYVKRFFREARIIAQLQHPYIINIIESNFSNNEFYIVTEYLAGGDLKKLIRSRPVSLVMKLGIISKIIEALDFAHQKGIIHRDLKPSNILLSKELEPKLCDFGIATALWGQESKLTRTNEIMGTMDYISPEQKENPRQVDLRTDIYSLGVILYQMVTGRKPLGAFKEPKKVVTSIPDLLNQIILKCLQYKPGDRYKNSHNLNKELRKAIKDLEQGDNPEPETSYRLGKIGQTETEIVKPGLDEMVQIIKKGTLTQQVNLKADFLNNINPEYEKELLSLLKSIEGFAKEVVIEALGRLKSKAACPALVELLKDPYYNRVTADALGQIKCKNAEENLISILCSGKDFAYISISPLGKLKSVKAAKHLVKFLKSPHSWIKELTLKSLAEIGQKTTLKFIKNTAENDEDGEIRALAKTILRRLNKNEQ